MLIAKHVRRTNVSAGNFLAFEILPMGCPGTMFRRSEVPKPGLIGPKRQWGARVQEAFNLQIDRALQKTHHRPAGNLGRHFDGCAAIW